MYPKKIFFHPLSKVKSLPENYFTIIIKTLNGANMRYWIGVASLDHVKKGSKEDFDLIASQMLVEKINNMIINDGDYQVF